MRSLLDVGVSRREFGRFWISSPMKPRSETLCRKEFLSLGPDLALAKIMIIASVIPLLSELGFRALVIYLFIAFGNVAAATPSAVLENPPELSPRAFEFGLRSYENFKATQRPSVVSPVPTTLSEWFFGVDPSKYKKIYPNTRYFSIVDFTLPSNRKRLFIFDTQTGLVESYFVSHGQNSGGGLWVTQVSNSLVTSPHSPKDMQSLMSPAGRFSVLEPFVSARSGPALRLIGLSRDNKNTARRNIYLHGADGVNPGDPYARENGAPKLSDGCFMVERRYLKHIFARLKGRSSLFVYWDPQAVQNRMSNTPFSR